MLSWNAKSKAYIYFEESLGLAEALLKIERQYDDPPKLKDQRFVEGLRGGSVVLMVGAFEQFLKSAFQEHLSTLSVFPKATYNKLPERMRMHCVFSTLEHAMSGPPSRNKLDRLSDVESACQLVISETINPVFFIDTQSNPNAKAVEAMFSKIGKDEIFNVIMTNFGNRWATNTPISYTPSARFIMDKLNEILDRRHRVAHTATVLNIARNDLDEAVRFLRILARVLDLELNKHIRNIKR
ncbi:MAG TPA: HEPN domain-containing protein [Ktedonobacteraceae bacterium]|nr:HEPN domain-containing protein [Ktedonobacteraceae bacterium]